VTLSDLKRLSRRNTRDVAVHLRILEGLGVMQSLREGTKQRFYCASPEADSLSHVGELRVHYSIGRASAWHHRGSDSQTFACESAVGKLSFEAVSWFENPDS